MSRALLKTTLLATALCAATSVAARDAQLEERVARLERLMQSQGLVEMLTQLEQLQQEVQRLRGDVEVQGHNLEQLKQRQRDLYSDIDSRLQALEAGSASSVTTAPPISPGTTPAATVSSPTASAPTVASTPPVNPDEARQAYEQALNILRQGRYTEAATAYQKFLGDYPGSDYADNAQYWLAETYYVTRQFDTALVEFNKVLEKYPGSSKLADARLKLGFIHYEKQDWGNARSMLETVRSQYPNSTAAKLASERLERMTKEGR